MAITVQDIGDAALRLIGQMGAPGRGSSPEEQAEYLFELNNIVDQFNAERLMIYEITRQAYAMTASVSAYTMGPAGTFSSTRPARIEALALQTADPQEEPIKILSYAEWIQIPLKTAQGSITKVAWIDYAYPSLIVNFFPVQSLNTSYAVVYAWEPLAGFASVGADVTLPPAYQMLLEYTLAVNLAPRYRRPLDASVAALAGQAKQAVARINQQTLPPDQIVAEVPAGDPAPDPSVGQRDAA